MNHVILNPEVPLQSECECSVASNGGPSRSQRQETHAYAPSYMVWRETHSGHGHLVQTFRTADDGPSARYACPCGSVFSGPALTCGPKLFLWSKQHRKHLSSGSKLRGEVS